MSIGTLNTTLRPRRGFTTVEFMGAIAISLILSVVAMAGYHVYEREMPVKYAARRLTHALSTARTYAISSNSTYAVKIDWNSNNFWIDEMDPSGSTITVPKVISPELLDAQVRLASVLFGASQTNGFDPQTNTTTIRFYAQGNSDDVRIFLQMQGQNQQNDASYYTIRLYGPTGQSRVFENQRLLPGTAK